VRQRPNRRRAGVVAPAPAAPASPPAEPAPVPAPSSPAPLGPKQYDAATLFKNVGIRAAGFSHGGSKALVSTDESGVLLESIPPWWASFRDALCAEMGDPATDKPRLQAISPLCHAEQVKKPRLVVQGTNDPRVLKIESDEIVAAVKHNGVPVEYLVFDDEGHGFQKQTFLDTYLRAK